MDDRGSQQDKGSSLDNQNPSNDGTKTYSESEVRQLLSERHSKLDQRIAELTKENKKLSVANKQVKDLESELEEAQSELSRVKGEFAKKDPDFTSIYAKEEELAKSERELKRRIRAQDSRESEFETEISQLNVSRHENAVRAAAKAAGVDAELALSIIPEPYEGMDIDRVLGRLPKGNGNGSGGTQQQQTQTEKTGLEAWQDEGESQWSSWQPDSGQSSGGVRQVSQEALQKAADSGDIEEYKRLRALQDKT